MIDIIAQAVGVVSIGLLVIVAGWVYASGPGRRARQRRHDAWMRKIRHTYGRGEP